MKTFESFHPYQNRCVDYLLSHEKCGLFLDMGLGKTAIVLKAVDELMNDYVEIGRVLVVAPVRVASYTWPAEAEKWEDLHLTVNAAVGTRKQRERRIDEPSDIVTVSRDGLGWLVEYLDETKRHGMFDMIVVDESSGFKNRNTDRWKALNKLCNTAKRVLLLTGTPVPNGYGDLWSQMYLLDRGERLGRTLTSYRRTYFDSCDNGGRYMTYTIRKGAEDEIRKKISDICVSMRSEDYLTLPDRICNNVDVVLPDKAMETYGRMERDMLVELCEKGKASGTVIEAANAAAVTGKLLQMASGAVYDENGEYHELHDAKTKALEEIIESNDGKPILVFYNYRNEYERLSKAFAKLEPKTIATGRDIDDWNEGRTKLLLVNPASAGHGLNLQAGGHIIVWYSLTWNLELYEQANKRLHRQGQTEPVIIHHLIAKGTMDEVVLKRLRSKGRTQDELLEYIKARVYDGNDPNKTIDGNGGPVL